MRNLPKDLNATYDRMLNLIPVQDQRKACIILSCLAFLPRGFRVNELAQAAVVEIEAEFGHAFSLDKCLFDPEAVADICGGLVVFLGDNCRRRAVLAHHSVKEYLVSGRNGDTTKFWFPSTRSEGLLLVGRVFLAFLISLDASISGSIYRSRPNASQGIEMLRTTAKKQWSYCFRQSLEAHGHHKLEELAWMLMSPANDNLFRRITSMGRRRFIRVEDISHSSHRKLEQAFLRDRLAFAAVHGLVPLVKRLLGNPAHVGAWRTKDLGFALEAAARGDLEMLKDSRAKERARTTASLPFGNQGVKGQEGNCENIYGAVVGLLIARGAQVDCRPNNRTPLQVAASRGRTSMLKRLLDEGADINAVGSRGTVLFEAVNSECGSAVELLLKMGAKFNARNGEHFLALRISAENCHVSTLRLIINTNIDLLGPEAAIILQSAARSLFQPLKKVELLLERGVDINARGDYNETVLQAAIGPGRSALVALLLEKGVDVNAVGGTFGTALQSAVNAGDPEIVELLLKYGADATVLGGAWESPLIEAASKHGQVRILELLLDSGTDTSIQQGDKDKALYLAAGRANLTAVKLLLRNGADVNGDCGVSGSALHAASYGGEVAVMDILLRSGANFNAGVGFQGGTLHAAAFGGHIAAIDYLLASGVDVNACDDKGWTALHAGVCSHSSSHAVTRRLLDRGAHANIKGPGNLSPLLHALYHSFFWIEDCSRGAEEVVHHYTRKELLRRVAIYRCKSAVGMLLAEGADPHAKGGRYGNALQAAASCRWGGAEEVFLILESGVSVNIHGGHYGYALQAAARRGNEKALRVLLDHGADVLARGGKYGNALQAAAFSGRNAFVSLLLKVGADAHASDGIYGQALQAAAAAGHVKTMKLLLKRGKVDVNAKGGRHGSALEAAVMNGHRDAAKMLLKGGAHVCARIRLSSADPRVDRKHEAVDRLLVRYGATQTKECVLPVPKGEKSPATTWTSVTISRPQASLWELMVAIPRQQRQQRQRLVKTCSA